MNITKRQKIIIHLILGVATVIYWGYIQLTHTVGKPLNHWYEAMFMLTPLVGGVFGIHTARRWSGLKSKVGQGIFFISLGLLAWGIGQLFWVYYNLFTHTDVPYPSLADIGYILAVPLWMIGVIQLSKATGAKFGLRTAAGRVAMVVLPVVSTALSYYLLVTVGRDGQLDPDGESTVKLFFDFAYPLGDVIIVSIVFTTVALSWKYLGGRFKWPVLFTLAGFGLEYLADFAFSYTTTKGTFYAGCWVDLLFPMALLVIALGVVLLDPSKPSSSQVGKSPLPIVS